MRRPRARDDGPFHRRRAAKELAAASSARSITAHLAHRKLALEHELAAYRSAEAQELELFDEERFLRFALAAAIDLDPDMPDLEPLLQGLMLPPRTAETPRS